MHAYLNQFLVFFNAQCVDRRRILSSFCTYVLGQLWQPEGNILCHFLSWSRKIANFVSFVIYFGPTESCRRFLQKANSWMNLTETTRHFWPCCWLGLKEHLRNPTDPVVLLTANLDLAESAGGMHSVSKRPQYESMKWALTAPKISHRHCTHQSFLPFFPFLPTEKRTINNSTVNGIDGNWSIVLSRPLTYFQYSTCTLVWMVVLA